MQSADYWRLCDDLSIFQAIMLILEYDPAQQDSRYVQNNKYISAPEGFGALKTALCNAVLSEKIKTNIIYEYDEYERSYLPNQVDIDKTILSVEDIRNFLRAKGIMEGFFFPQGSISEPYLDSENACFAPKLSAAVHAWKAISDSPEKLKAKTPKQALEKWLRENASQYGLTKDDGTPNETAIEEISKIANWKPEGGAAKTPTGGQVQDNPPTPQLTPRKLKVFGENSRVEYQEKTSSKVDEFDLGDEIPF